MSKWRKQEEGNHQRNMTRKLSRTEGNDGKLCLMPNTVDIQSPTPRPFMVTFQNTTGKEKILLIFRKDKRMRNETGSWDRNIIERWKKNKDNLLTFWRQMISNLEFYTWPSCQSSRIEIFSDTQSQKILPRMLFFPRNSCEIYSSKVERANQERNTWETQETGAAV